MPKVFNISLHRSGTQSFQKFMQAHGLRAAHWPGRDFETTCAGAVENLDTEMVWRALEGIRAHHDTFCDLPYPLVYKEAANQYPDAKFLLILREVGSWIASVRRLIGERPLSTFEKFQLWSISPHRFGLLTDYKDMDLERAYLSHISRTAEFMLKKGVSFRIFWLNDQRLGSQCADYLGFDQRFTFPTVDFLSERAHAPEVK